MQHLGVNFGVFGGLNFFLYLGLYFLLRKSRMIFNSPVTTHGNGVNAHRPRATCGRVQCNANAMIYPFKSVIMWRIQTPHLVQLMNIVSNYIFDCNNRDANRAFVTFREITAPVTTSLLVAYLMQNLRLRGRPPPIIFARIVRPMNALQLSLTVFRERNLLGATSENRWQIGDFAPTQSLWPKISGRRGRPPPIIFCMYS